MLVFELEENRLILIFKNNPTVGFFGKIGFNRVLFSTIAKSLFSKQFIDYSILFTKSKIVIP